MAEELSVWERCARIAEERYKNCRKEIEQLKTDVLGGRKDTNQWIKAAGRGAFEAKVIADNIRAAENTGTLGCLAAAGRSVWGPLPELSAQAIYRKRPAAAVQPA